ncbi:MAG TPA: AbrB/MazE/SpoVT family DNA-binding domain-containing protein [Thermoanaerobaculia bacterium]|jgi:AbrB family looped-hinge helix DNA binding protein|nr:AbrB/MazE/SpoVT family DNA-binding domain-containing protein [Thermoanaerobaculia bacterium]
MAKVTSKLQVTVPKAIADRFGIRPGDEIEFMPGEDSLRILLSPEKTRYDAENRLRLFDQATQRQREREKGRNRAEASETDRGWTREELYDRGRPD